MGLFKKNPVFCIFIALCLLVAAGGAYLAYRASSGVSEARSAVAVAERQLEGLRKAAPAPSAQNVEASAENVARLQAELDSIREDLRRGNRLQASTDGVGVMAAIQQFITEYQRRVGNHRSDGEPAPIQTPENFAFGFDAYIDEATVPEDVSVVPVLDKQRQILGYILNQLIAADPQSIQAVEREIVELASPGGDEERQNRQNGEAARGFTIGEAVSARVPGAIETMAFRVAFTGYTDVLRDFLNNLAAFKLPVVVRSIEVERPSGAETTADAQEGRDQLDDIFSVFGGAGQTAPETASEGGESEPRQAQKPIIAENISRFIVTLEFIEIVLPSEAEDSAS